ncbi:hypothetical protein [Planctomicrobium piriforme]|uniref:Uncharacterized protein n=1 Tax=Planctomicrobium piriforme TaxID=1576369 RepID=A0A1I3NLM4_9PLAN|nr:hypothetical protein [Planctomicrobium piriforme]SFJ10193.1 hypothetical protein SAMN05421753_115138 [Planctomicrobium piriforme]
MNEDLNRLRVTMEQMERLLLALNDLKENVLPKDPGLFATMAEGPLEDLERLRKEVQETPTLDDVYAILNRRHSSGKHDQAERHNEHQP